MGPSHVPEIDDCWINLDPDLLRGWSLVPHYGPAAKMAFDVPPVRRHQINDLPIRSTLATDIAHYQSIAVIGEGVKGVPRLKRLRNNAAVMVYIWPEI